MDPARLACMPGRTAWAQLYAPLRLPLISSCQRRRSLYGRRSDAPENPALFTRMSINPSLWPIWSNACGNRIPVADISDGHGRLWRLAAQDRPRAFPRPAFCERRQWLHPRLQNSCKALCPIPPLPPVIATTLPGKTHGTPPGLPQRSANPGNVRVAQMPPVVEGQSPSISFFPQGSRRRPGSRLPPREIGVGRSQDAPKFPAPFRRRLKIEDLGLHPRCARLVEACFDDARGTGQARRGRFPRTRHLQVGLATEGIMAILLPLSALLDRISRTSDVTTVHRQSRNALKSPIGAHVGNPECLSHVGRKVDIARKITQSRSRQFCCFNRACIDPPHSGPYPLQWSQKQKSELMVEPPIGSIEGKFVVETVCIGQEPRRLDRYDRLPDSFR